jgi:hypothetical protein
MAIGSLDAPASSEDQAAAPSEPVAVAPEESPAETPPLAIGDAPVSSTPDPTDGETATPPPAGSYGLAGSYGAPATPATAIPTIGSSVEVPPLGGENGEGGEWDLLSGKLRDWLDRKDLGGYWERLGGPLRASGLLLGGLILIKLYEALLETLDDIPLLPRLLQLAGLLYLVNFGFTHLIKSQDRENLYQIWKKRWHDFTGRP